MGQQTARGHKQQQHLVQCHPRPSAQLSTTWMRGQWREEMYVRKLERGEGHGVGNVLDSGHCVGNGLDKGRVDVVVDDVDKNSCL